MKFSFSSSKKKLDIILGQSNIVLYGIRPSAESCDSIGVLTSRLDSDLNTVLVLIAFTVTTGFHLHTSVFVNDLISSCVCLLKHYKQPFMVPY